MSDGKKLDLTATVKRVGYRSFTSWGDPSHNDDWETPAIVLWDSSKEIEKIGEFGYQTGH